MDQGLVLLGPLFASLLLGTTAFTPFALILSLLTLVICSPLPLRPFSFPEDRATLVRLSNSRKVKLNNIFFSTFFCHKSKVRFKFNFSYAFSLKHGTCCINYKFLTFYVPCFTSMTTSISIKAHKNKTKKNSKAFSINKDDNIHKSEDRKVGQTNINICRVLKLSNQKTNV